MTKYNVFLVYDATRKYFFAYKGTGLPIDVYIDPKFDQTNKRFKRYVSYIQYPKNENYKGTDYTIYIYNNTSWTLPSLRYIFTYNTPSKQVRSLEFYYQINDHSNQQPLVVGFEQVGENNIVYYTYKHIHFNSFTSSLPAEGSFTKTDLTSRLTEELGIYVGNKHRRLLFKLEVMPKNNNQIKYHNSGVFHNKVIVTRLSYNESFDKCVHTVDTSLNVTSFYLYHGDKVVYVNGESEFGLDHLKCVEVIISKYDNKKHIFVLGFITKKNKTSYYEFKKIFEKSDSDIKLESFQPINETELKTKLENENDQIDKKVSYIIESTKRYNYKINFETFEITSNNYKYKKYRHEPFHKYTTNLTELIYNDSKLKIIIKKHGIIDRVEKLREEQYSEITVFFGEKDPNVPIIIELVISRDGNREYYNHVVENGIDYWERWNISSDLVKKDNQELIKKIKEGESTIATPIFFVINKIDKYGLIEIQENFFEEMSQDQPAETSVLENNNIEWLRKAGFKCYEHTFRITPISGSSESNNIVLRLLAQINSTSITNNYKYSEIKFYTSPGTNRQFINYKSSKNKLCVYYYKTDPRPLLVCYDGNAFRPKDLDSYFNTWIEIDSITKCFCESNDSTTALNELRKIVYLMNPVKIDQNLEKTKKREKYNTHSYYKDNSQINIEIEISSEDMSCFKKYVHKSSNDFPLGEIIHSNYKLFKNFNDYKTINGNHFKFPTSVHAYYYLYDSGHQNVLLIVLEYANEGVGNNSSIKKYYRLNGNGDSLWSNLTNTDNLNDNEELEKLLREIKDSLGLYFEKTEENLIISSSDDCHEGGVAGPVAGTLTTLGLAGAGIGLGYYFRPDLFTIFYRRLF